MKFITLSFDDGEIYDRELTVLLRRYGLKAPFGLCCGYSGAVGELPDGRKYEKICVEEIAQTYAGFELCSHGFYHRDFTELSERELQKEISGDIDAIRTYADKCVAGVIYPGGKTDPFVTGVLRNFGIKYARMADSSYNFDVPSDFMLWKPTCHILDSRIFSLISEFERCGGDAVFGICGHSYELFGKESREKTENVLSRLSALQNVRFTTLYETYSYFTNRRL